mmetsp:Transcript_127786/g.303558  ORF Transcript_127786/g.303558 Transcript_127786/m.303558 type:complete len:243 (+) Transcript_127786:211-939(+)
MVELVEGDDALHVRPERLQQQLEEDDSTGVDVDFVRTCRAPSLSNRLQYLRRGIARSTASETAAGCQHVRRKLVELSEQLVLACKAKVANADHSDLCALGYAEDVVGLQVGMNDALAVDVAHGKHQRSEDVCGIRKRSSLPLQPGSKRQRLPLIRDRATRRGPHELHFDQQHHILGRCLAVLPGWLWPCIGHGLELEVLHLRGLEDKPAAAVQSRWGGVDVAVASSAPEATVAAGTTDAESQ